MPFKSAMYWFQELVLRTLIVILTGFILLNIWKIYQAYQTIAQNPLLPRTLAPYTAFAHYFFIGFYGLVIWSIARLLRKKSFGYRGVFIMLLVVCFELFKFYVYGFLMWLNPFG